jgi:hypothetical protein
LCRRVLADLVSGVDIVVFLVALPARLVRLLSISSATLRGTRRVGSIELWTAPKPFND